MSSWGDLKSRVRKLVRRDSEEGAGRGAPAGSSTSSLPPQTPSQETGRNDPPKPPHSQSGRLVGPEKKNTPTQPDPPRGHLPEDPQSTASTARESMPPANDNDSRSVAPGDSADARGKQTFTPVPEHDRVPMVEEQGGNGTDKDGRVDGDHARDTPSPKPSSKPSSESSSGSSLVSSSSFLPEEQYAVLLWNTAYDHLAKAKPDLLSRYEKLISLYIANDGLPDPTSSSYGNLVGPEKKGKGTDSGAHARAQTGDGPDAEGVLVQMDDLLEGFLLEPTPRGGGDGDQEDDNEDSGSGVETLSGDIELERRGLKAHLRESVKRSRYASVAWAASCIVLECLLLGKFSSENERSECIAVLSKMEWYIGLSKLFFDDRELPQNDTETELGSTSAIQRLIRLYESILLYQISIACRNLKSVDGGAPDDHVSKELELRGYADGIEQCEQALASFDGEPLKAGLEQHFHGRKEAESADAKYHSRLLERLNVVEPPSFERASGEDVGMALLNHWARSTAEYGIFVSWDDDHRGRVLWLDGGPGAGKTKLLQAAARGFPPADSSSTSTASKQVAYFFCDGSDCRQGSALYAFKTLIFHVLKHQPELDHHLMSKFDSTDRKDFNEPSDFYALATLLYALISDENFQPMYFIIDEIDGLATDGDLDLIVDLILTTAEVSDKVRWLVSLDHGCRGAAALAKVRKDKSYLNLTLPSTRDGAVRNIATTYAASRMRDMGVGMAVETRINEVIPEVQDASNNLLWLKTALDAVKESPAPWNAFHILKTLREQAPDINSMYWMRYSGLGGTYDRDRRYCIAALWAAAMAYRPLEKAELAMIINLPLEVDVAIFIDKALVTFLELHENVKSGAKTVHFVHPSARDFFRAMSASPKGPGLAAEHADMARKCLMVLLADFGFSAHEGPVATDRAYISSDYAAIFWIRHLSEAGESGQEATELAIRLLRDYSVEWAGVLGSNKVLLDALGMMRELNKTLEAMAKKLAAVHTQVLPEVVLEASRFLKAYQREGDERRAGSPQNSLIFYPGSDRLRERLLKKHFPFLDVAPVIEAQDPAPSTSPHVMRHEDWVRGCVFSPDARLVLSASDDESLRIWDVATGRLQHVLGGFSGYVYSVAVSRSGPDGRALIAAHGRSVIRIWELSTGRLLKVLDGFVDPGSGAGAQEGSDGGGDREAGEGVAVGDSRDDGNGALQKFEDELYSIAITQDGRRLAGAVGKKLVVWSLPSFSSTIWQDDEEKPGQDWRRVAFSCNGTSLASSSGPVIKIWDAAGRVTARLPKYNLPSLDGEPRQSPPTPSGNASGMREGAEDDPSDKTPPPPEGGTELGGEANGGNNRPPNEGADDGEMLIAGSSQRDSPSRSMANEEAEAPEEPPGVPLEQMPGHAAAIDGLAFSPGDEFLASGSDDGTARIWDVKKGTTLAVLKYHDSHVNSVCFSPDSTTLATGSTDNSVGIWKQQEKGVWGPGTLTEPQHAQKAHSGLIWSVAFAPKGGLVASSSNDGTIRIWDTEAEPARVDRNTIDEARQPEPPVDLDDAPPSLPAGPGHMAPVALVSASPDGKMIASASQNGVLCLWDGRTGKMTCTMDRVHTEVVTALVFSKSRSRLVSTSRDNLGLVWEVSQGRARLLYRLAGHEDWVRGAAISQSGALVATASDDRTVRVWSIAAADDNRRRMEEADREGSAGTDVPPVSVFRGHVDWIFGVAFSPDDRYLASVSDASEVLLWDLTDLVDKGAPEKKLVATRRLGRLRSVLFSPDSKRLVTTSWMNEVVVWELGGPSDEEPCFLRVSAWPASALIRMDDNHPDTLLDNLGASIDLVEALRISKMEDENLVCRPRDRPPVWAPVEVSREEWIKWKGKEVIFLPREFRATNWEACWAQGSSAVIGCPSGQVLLFRFSDATDADTDAETKVMPEATE